MRDTRGARSMGGKEGESAVAVCGCIRAGRGHVGTDRAAPCMDADDGAKPLGAEAARRLDERSTAEEGESGRRRHRHGSERGERRRGGNERAKAAGVRVGGAAPRRGAQVSTTTGAGGARRQG